MSSGFSTTELLKSASTYPVTKGDFDGHPFRGNQWEQGSGTATVGGPRTPRPRAERRTPLTRQPALHAVFIRADGNVNPRNGKPSGGTKTPRTYDTGDRHVIVQGLRPGGSTFTRMLPAGTGAHEKILNDRVTFYDSPSGKWKGDGTVVGTVSPSEGMFSGLVPDRPLSFNEVR